MLNLLIEDEGFRRLTKFQFEEIDCSSCDSSLSLESMGTAGPLSQGDFGKNGAFFSVVIPRGLGPVHILRLILSYMFEGRIKDEVFILVIYDMIERIFHHAEKHRDFRIKWRNLLKGLILLAKVLPLISKNLDSLSKVKYLLSNRLNQEINFIKFLIPFSQRTDETLEGIRVLRHRKYQPTPKKSTKVPSNSQGTKGSYQPDSINWKDVATKQVIFENGKWVKVYDTPSKNTGELLQ